MLLTISDDVRVILIKLADRLHNMKTLESLPDHKQQKIGSETLYIYAPLAHRLGLYSIKTELEDLGLKYTDRDTYDEISKKLIESKKDQDEYIDKFNSIISSTLTKEKLKYNIRGRTKSIFSINNKMIRQGISFEEVYDKFAVRIVYKSKPEKEKFIAWKIYSIITDNFTPNPTRLRDWISAPKSTGYEALHITVVGPKSKWVEVQIRSERMDEIAEKGYAAHYKYKQKDDTNDNLDSWINKLQEALENSETNAVDFVEQFKLNLYSEEIFVFTPTGDLKSLPKGATPLDFAFAIHTEVGLKTRGAKVNGKLVPLNKELSSGDRVEILTSDKIKPSANWLDYATTARAKSKIKATLNEEKKLLADEGKQILKRKLKHLKLSFGEDIIHRLQNYLNLQSSLDLFYGIGVGSIDNSYSTFDQNGAKVNDPWPTPFTSSGFDLDAVGAINLNSLSTNQYSIVSEIAVYPNPISNNTKLYFCLQKSASIRIVVHDVYGKELIAFSNRFQAGNNAFDFNGQILPTGVYFISLVNNDFSEVIKMIKNE